MRIVTIINETVLRWHKKDPILPETNVDCGDDNSTPCGSPCAFFNIQIAKGKDNGLDHTAPTTQYARCKKFIIGELRD